MSDTNRGYIWLRPGTWLGWTELNAQERIQAAFATHDAHACHEALSSIVHSLDPDHTISDWILIQGDASRKECYEQWIQDPLDDFLANLQSHIDNDHESSYYYKLIAERPNKKVEYIVGSFCLTASIERIVEEALPRSSRVRWVPLGYLATLGKGVEADPIIILMTASQTVALCMESGEIKDIRVFQFSVDRCLEQLRRDHFSENQARQFLEIDFSFLNYQKRDRILSLKIEVDQFLEDLKRLLLSRIMRADQPIWLAMDAFNHHDVMPAIQALTSNPVSAIAEKEWVRDGATNWSQHQERFLHVPHKKIGLKIPSLKDGKKFIPLLVGSFLVAIVLGMFALQQRVNRQILQIAQTRDELVSVRQEWLEKLQSIPDGAKALSKMEKLRDQVQNIRKGIMP